jgi:predicted MFS family arabinose efflux permease
MSTQKAPLFTSYQVFVIAILAFLQFTVILDFLVLNPLGAILMPRLHIEPGQFGLVVSAYAFSAGLSGFLVAGYADQFDRKRLLLFFYAGFLLGTALCAMATSYQWLLIARIVTGIFGGVLGSVVGAITIDLFPMEVRGRVMGFVQTAFAASQVLGLPIGLSLASRFDWHAPFWMIVGLGAIVGVLIFFFLKPINEHLNLKLDKDPFGHIGHVLGQTDYQQAFLAVVLLATGGYMIMPFASAFSTHNIGISFEQLPWVYGITGIFSIVLSPFIGRLNDLYGRFNTFLIGTVISMLAVAVYTRLGITPLWEVIAINIVLFLGINFRIISSSTLISGIPSPADRGAFMSVSSSVQLVSGGLSSYAAGLIVVKHPDGMIGRYDWLGNVVIAAMFITVWLVYRLEQRIKVKKIS